MTRYTSQLPLPVGRKTEGPARIVAVVNQKGGCGKSSVAMQVAGALGRDGYRVLVVDADVQGTATRWSASAPDDQPFPAVVVGLAAAGKTLHREVAKLADGYDLVVIDTPPAVDSPHAQAALLIANLAIIPLPPSPPDLWAAVGVRDLIQATVNDELQARILLNMAQPNTTLGREVTDALADFGIPLLKTQLGMRQVYRQCAVYGCTVQTMKPRDAKAAEEVEALTAEVLELLGVSS